MKVLFRLISFSQEAICGSLIWLTDCSYLVTPDLFPFGFDFLWFSVASVIYSVLDLKDAPWRLHCKSGWRHFYNCVTKQEWSFVFFIPPQFGLYILYCTLILIPCRSGSLNSHEVQYKRPTR